MCTTGAALAIDNQRQGPGRDHRKDIPIHLCSSAGRMYGLLRERRDWFPIFFDFAGAAHSRWNTVPARQDRKPAVLQKIIHVYLTKFLGISESRRDSYHDLMKAHSVYLVALGLGEISQRMVVSMKRLENGVGNAEHCGTKPPQILNKRRWNSELSWACWPAHLVLCAVRKGRGT